MKRHPDPLLPCVLDGRATRDIEPGEVVKVQIRSEVVVAGERLYPSIIPLQLGPDGQVYQLGGDPGGAQAPGVAKGKPGEEE